MNIFKRKKTPRINSFVKFDKDKFKEKTYELFFKEKFEGKLFIFLGEIPNAKGHCILADLNSGHVIEMYHTSDFIEAPEEEI